MRLSSALGVCVGLIALGGCAAEQPPAPASSAPAPGPVTSGPAMPEPSAPAPAASTPAADPPPTEDAATDAIRDVDWREATVRDLDFCGVPDADVKFRDGTDGNDIPCVILPGKARPAYADFLTEEPANAPKTEDALVLVELGNPGAARRQALVPVQLGHDGRTLNARPAIEGDEPSPAGDRVMTFTAYRVENDRTVTATVRTLAGRTETRRYRQADGTPTWERI